MIYGKSMWRVSHVQVVRGIDSHCDEAAKKMVEGMPNWQPAVYKNRTVRSVEVLPVCLYCSKACNTIHLSVSCCEIMSPLPGSILVLQCVSIIMPPLPG